MAPKWFFIVKYITYKSRESLSFSTPLGTFSLRFLGLRFRFRSSFLGTLNWSFSFLYRSLLDWLGLRRFLNRSCFLFFDNLFSLDFWLRFAVFSLRFRSLLGSLFLGLLLSFSLLLFVFFFSLSDGISFFFDLLESSFSELLFTFFLFLSPLLTGQLSLSSSLQTFFFSLLSSDFGSAFLGDSEFSENFLSVFSQLLMISLKFVLILINFVCVIDISFEIVLFFLELILIFFLFLLTESFPVIFDHFVDISRAGIFVFFLILVISLFEETSIRS